MLNQNNFFITSLFLESSATNFVAQMDISHVSTTLFLVLNQRPNNQHQISPFSSKSSHYFHVFKCIEKSVEAYFGVLGDIWWVFFKRKSQK